MDLEKMKALFGESFGEFKEEVIVDFNKPINGKYRARIDNLTRRTGTSQNTGKDYDFLSLKLQIFEDVDGDKSFNRFVDVTCFLQDSEYATAKESFAKLVNGLYINGVLDDVEFAEGTPEELLDVAGVLVDKTVSIVAYKNKSGKQGARLVKPHTEAAVVDDNWV